MKKISMIGATLVAAAVLCAAPVSLHQSQNNGLLLSLDKARAVVGRPLTPGSVAGVHRRHERRAYRRGGYYGHGYGYSGYAHRPYGYYGYHHAGTAAGQLTCRDAAKLQYPNERQMRKAFKKECKEAYKASTHTAAAH
jgi:hypothetical protein